jgi:hypothetical protein
MDGFKFKHAFLQELGSGRLRHEEQLVADELTLRNIPFTLFTYKRIQRRQLPLDGETFLVGDMDCIQGALKQLDVPAPSPNDYPKSMSSFMRRRTWRSTLADLERDIAGEGRAPVFAKPASRQKRFTGKVFNGTEDFYSVSGVSRAEEILCSEVVKWLSEYRVYVIQSRIVSIDNYAGDKNIPLDVSAVESALAALQNAEEAPAAYGIDFGVLDTGQTALVEMNDGVAIGAYSIDKRPYTDLLMTRWAELISSRRALPR